MESLRIVVLINTDDPEPMRLMRESYESIFNKLAPGANVEFFNGVLDPQLPQIGPDQLYDLLVIGGGTYVPRDDAQWMKRLVEFEKKLYFDCPDQKVLGICLGHQTMTTTLGGTLAFLPEPEVRSIHDW